MKLIIGLGNPGKEYQNTRHNLGFFIIEKLYQFHKNNFSSFKFEKKFKAKISKGIINNKDVLLVMPQTFMNNSGEAVLKLVQFYKLKPENNLLIIYDDIDLLLEKIKTKGESSGGHKGMESIIKTLKTKKIPRIRCGILSKPKKEIINIAQFVLGNFSNTEKKSIITKTIPLAILEIKKFINL